MAAVGTGPEALTAEVERSLQFSLGCLFVCVRVSVCVCVHARVRRHVEWACAESAGLDVFMHFLPCVSVCVCSRVFVRAWGQRFGPDASIAEVKG